MKSYNQFLEATEADLKKMGASPSQIEMLKKRQTARGKGFSTGDDRVKTGAPAPSTPRKALPPGRSSGGMVRRAAGNVARRAANKGAAIVRQKASEKLKSLRTNSGLSRRKADSAAMGTRRGVRIEPEKRQPQSYRNVGAGKKDATQRGVAIVRRRTPSSGAYPDGPGKMRSPANVASKRKGEMLGNVAKGTAERTGNLVKGIGKRNLKRASKFIKKLQVPQTRTDTNSGESVNGPKKFGRSAS